MITSVYAASSPWTQTDWVGGSGQTSWSDNTKFDSSSSVTTSTAGQATLAATSSWYNTSWAYRRKITFDNSAQAENLTNFPVLVKLDPTRINYSNTQDSGQDIRFTDSDGTTLLSYEIEKWDETGSSFVWVKVPQIDSSSATDNIYMYYGNSSATDGQAATSVWDSNYKAVWHLKETSGGAGTIKDSTSNANNLTDTGSPTLNATGFVGPAVSFDGINDYLQIVGMSSPGTPLTIEFFAKPNSATPVGMFDTATGQANVARNYSSGNVEWWNNSPAVSLGLSATTWVHLSFVYRFSGTRIIDWYKNGVAQTSGTGNTTTTLAWTNLTFGNINGGGAGWYAGFLDEIRVSNSARSAAWIAASYKSEADTFNTFASEEPQVQTSGTLTSSIFDSEFSAARSGER